MKESVLLLEKAERSLSVAEDLLDKGENDFASSRTYYAYFYVARALLLTRGVDFSRHGQTIAQYGNFFSKTGQLPTEFHQLLIKAFKLRQVADYQTEVAIDSEMVTELIEGGRRFVAAASSYLEQLSAPDEESNE